MTRHPAHDRTRTDGATPDAAMVSAPEENLPLIIAHADMDAAFERGDAVPVAQSIGWLMRYRAAWWVIYEQGWLRVIEGPIATSIDHLYPRLAAAETAAQDKQPHQRPQRP